MTDVSMQQRVMQSAQYVVDYAPSALAPASFRWADGTTSIQGAGLYYDLGGILRAGVTAPGNDVLSELVLQQAWLVSVRTACMTAFPGEEFWKGPLDKAQSRLTGYIVPENVNLSEQATVDKIKNAMAEERKTLDLAVLAYAAARKKNAHANPDLTLAAPKYRVPIVTVPAGAEVAYVPVDQAAMQVARSNARFPEGISYYNVTGPDVELGGSYVFRVKWPAFTKYFPGVRVTGANPIRLEKGVQ